MSIGVLLFWLAILVLFLYAMTSLALWLAIGPGTGNPESEYWPGPKTREFARVLMSILWPVVILTDTRVGTWEQFVLRARRRIFK